MKQTTIRFRVTNILLLFSSFAYFSGVAQSKVESLSPSQVLSFYKQAQASGMSEMQIEQAALTQGFTLTDIAKMRQRISQVNKGEGEADNQTDIDTLVAPRKQVGQLSMRKKDPLKDTMSKKLLRVFGTDFFDNERLTFEPNLRIATPKNYQLGPDDELNVDISGNASGRYKLKVSPDGMVKIPDLAPIYVSGLDIEDAKQKIVGSLRQMYSGLNAGGSYASITLGNVRSIKVIITGEVKRPGTYTVSSFATAFNALYLCGGPKENGTYRNIKVIRNNKLVRTIDLYDFLLNADQAHNIVLRDQDIIQVPFYDVQVVVKGETKRDDAIYEMKQGETLKELLAFAGGFNSKAYRASIAVERNTDRQQKMVNVPQDKYDTFIPQSGDRYMVGRIINRFENIVKIAGAVNRVGQYAIDENIKTVKQLIGQAGGLREDAFKTRAVIHREKENREPEILAIDLQKILSSEAEDIALQNQDSLVIQSIKELRQDLFLSIYGEINKAKDFSYSDGMTVSDLVLMSGGFREGAIGSRMEIARRISTKNKNSGIDETVQIISFKIDKNLSLNPTDAQFRLEPFDIVYVRKSPNYDVQKQIIVAGEVNYPGQYAILNNIEKVSSLIERAGGIKKGGYLSGAVLRRKGERVAIDIAAILANPDVEGNIHVENGDSLFIPEMQETVRITGAVLNPSVVNFSKASEFNDYLSQAGGFGKESEKRKVYVTYANGYTERTKRFLFFKKYPKIEPGATIFVPYKPQDNTPSSITGPVLLSFVGTLVTAMVLYFSRK